MNKKSIINFGAGMAIIGGIISIVAQWVPDLYLPLIAGIIALIGGIISLE